jgi:hypothetical protein
MLVKWLLIYLRSGVLDQANKDSGLGPTARATVIRRLEAHGTLDAMPPPGRPVKFTADVCAHAVELLAEHDGEFLTLRMLLSLLVEEDWVDSKAHVDTFSKHLRKYVRAQGMHINTTCTSTVFLLAQQGWQPRVKFCREALALLERTPLDQIIFVDETTVEECPHPKGKRSLRRPAC